MPLKLFFLPLLIASVVWGGEQIVFVVADDFNASTATLQAYEKEEGPYAAVGEPVGVNLGRSGLGWGIGLPWEHAADEPLKAEGDGRAPAGVFRLGSAFGYARSFDTRMPYMPATDDLICVDDSASPRYNTLWHVDGSSAFGSFEWMHRDDAAYAIGVVVAHNPENVAQRGSCIFLHVEKAPNSPTSGCTSMRREALERLVRWLDPAKRPLLVQMPKSSCERVRDAYPGLECR